MMDPRPEMSSEAPTAQSTSRARPMANTSNREAARRPGTRKESKEEKAPSPANAAARPDLPRTNSRRSNSPQVSIIQGNRHHARSSSGLGPSNSSPVDGSPDTRIPRPRSTVPITTTERRRASQQTPGARQPLGLKAAYELAQRQQNTSGGDDTFDLQQAFHMANAEASGALEGSPSPAPRSYRSRRTPEDTPAGKQRNGNRMASSDLGEQLQQYDKNHQLPSNAGAINGLFANNRVGPRVAETGHILAKKASDSSIGATSERRRSSTSGSNQKNQDRADDEGSPRPLSSKSAELGRDHPLPSIEDESMDQDDDTATFLPANMSPSKSNWHLDADFTGGDLQISDSPRIKVTKASSKVERRESSTSLQGSQNSEKLEQNQEKEGEARQSTSPESAQRRNRRLDEIRSREIEALSKRAVATSRLDEIRLKNSEARSISPEDTRQRSTERPRGDSVSLDSPKPESKVETMAAEPAGERIPNTPVTIFRSASEERRENSERPSKEDSKKSNEGQDRPSLHRDDSHDLLRRLARATSSSPPAAEKPKPTAPASTDAVPSKSAAEERDTSRTRPARGERRARELGVKSSQERLRVGFAGLRRDLSEDSISDKRHSMSNPNSEIDPTERIEGELKLFAPTGDYSEKGSVRAPSPAVSEPIEEETPRPRRMDPLLQPTPRVTGAFVDTPATIKVEKVDDLDLVPTEKPVSEIAETRPRLRSRRPNQTAQDDPNIIHEEDDGWEVPSGKPVSRTSQRSRSRSRPRHTPQVNTAKPPSAKDDLRNIMRQHQLDDSTLDDFDEFDQLLANQEFDHAELERVVNDTMSKLEDELELPGLSAQERELQTYDRMSKSLKTGLMGIRSAKQGIERLEDKVAHAEHRPTTAPIKTEPVEEKPAAHLPPPFKDSSYYYIPIPSLYSRKPNFRFTTFGVMVFFLSIWYALESAFCVAYVPPYACTSKTGCDWSPNEPYYPYAMPFMLDEWASGGKGREIAWWLGDEVGDVVAEVHDWITGHDFTEEDELYMNVWQRSRHKRRLQKKGLVTKWIEPPDFAVKFAHWRASRDARDREAAAREQGIDMDGEDESMDADQTVR